MFKGCRYPWYGPVVVVVLVLCLGFGLTLLSLPARGSLDLSAFKMNHVLPSDQGAPVNAPPLEGSYSPFALAQDAEDEPVNSALLTMLFLASSFLGASVVGGLPANAQGQGALYFSSLGVGEILGSVRGPYLPFLGVFRL